MKIKATVERKSERVEYFDISFNVENPEELEWIMKSGIIEKVISDLETDANSEICLNWDESDFIDSTYKLIIHEMDDEMVIFEV